MTRQSRGSLGGGGGGGGGFGGSSFGSHGRSGGGSLGPPPPHHVPPPSLPHFPPPPPRRYPPPFSPPTYYAPPPVICSSGPSVAPSYQIPPQDGYVRYSRRAALLNQRKACFTFVLIALLLGTVWLYFGLYGSTVMEVGLHDSRLVTARPYFVQSMKFRNRHAMEGPLFYSFNRKPALNRQSTWKDFQNVTFCYEHVEFYYWMNKGSTVKIKYTLDVQKKLESVFFAILKENPEDLLAYYENPALGSVRLLESGDYKYEASADASYAFSLVTYNPYNVTVTLDCSFRTREYSTDKATQRTALKSNCEMPLSLFRTRYGLVQGPGQEKMGVDNWQIDVTYGIRWTAIIFIFGLVTLVYFVSKSMIMYSVEEFDTSLPETAPLVPPQVTESVAPSAPVLPATIQEEESADIPEDQLCSVCLDAPKDCFFVPCGHRATCYSCGLRISNSDQKNCPICRQPIAEVKRIYDS